MSENLSTRYRIGNKTYSSLSEMPEEIRSLFVDTNQDGIPDAFEGGSIIKKETRSVSIDEISSADWDKLSNEGNVRTILGERTGTPWNSLLIGGLGAAIVWGVLSGDLMRLVHFFTSLHQ